MTAPRHVRADDPSRTTLGKAADENFPVAPFFLPRDWRDDLMAVYGYARLVDDIGDGDLAPGGADAFGLAPDAGPLPLLDALEEDLHRVFDGTPRHPLLRGLQPTVRRRGLTPGPFLGLIQANRQDQLVRRYETYDDLLAYCELSANPVGRLVLGITGTATPERIRRSDEICTALQLVEHLQDVAEDLARDRIYLPAEDLKSFHVTEEELARPSAGAAVRSLVAFQAERARALMHAGLPLVGSVHGRLRLLLAGFAGGGLAALDAIAAAGFDVLSGPPKPTKPSLTRQAGAVLLRARREGGT
ncbi:squalene synthase HpnC [Streptomyces hydrogenans]|uniref:squalene synthase HpnC n=1 Tax=Streptomyces hydrogenans TaxID=1873719 RepID=UPI001CFD03E6|nr:squalene synthase HpnC [Streptomyces hydrogenans]